MNNPGHLIKKILASYRKSPPVTGMFLSVLLIFAAIMLWSTLERQNSFMTSQVNFGKKAALNAGESVTNELENRKRYMQLFVEDNIELIRFLVEEPDNDELFSLIKQQLSRYVPDLFTINITNNHAELLIDDFEGFTGNVCLNDVRDFADTAFHLSRVHPNHILYHYDILERFNKNNQEYIFFASFGLGKIQTALKHSSPEGHKLILVQEIPEPLIEVTETGGRNTIKDRVDFRLNENELGRVLSQTKIEGTYWFVMDMIDDELINAFDRKLILQNIIVFTIFTILLFVVRYFIVSNLLRKSKKIHELNSNLKGLLLIDALTGLYNKSYLEQQLHKEWSRALRDKKMLSVMLIDIDYFKLYNDHYGHLQGDKCLQEVAKIIQETFQRENDFAARFGGEEFCVVLNDSSAETPLKLADNAHYSLMQENIRHEASPTKPYVTFSIGIASIIPDHAVNPKWLLNKADQALYQAKEMGRNKTVISNQEDIRVKEKTIAAETET